MSENSTPTTKVCATCGTRVSEDATRCLVCGSALVPGDETESKTSCFAGSAGAREDSSFSSLTLSATAFFFRRFLLGLRQVGVLQLERRHPAIARCVPVIRQTQYPLDQMGPS